MATHSSTLAWRIPRTEEPGRPQSTGSQESDTTEATQHTQSLNLPGGQTHGKLDCLSQEEPQER